MFALGIKDNKAKLLHLPTLVGTGNDGVEGRAILCHFGESQKSIRYFDSIYIRTISSQGMYERNHTGIFTVLESSSALEDTCVASLKEVTEASDIPLEMWKDIAAGRHGTIHLYPQHHYFVKTDTPNTRTITFKDGEFTTKIDGIRHENNAYKEAIFCLCRAR